MKNEVVIKNTFHSNTFRKSLTKIFLLFASAVFTFFSLSSLLTPTENAGRITGFLGLLIFGGFLICTSIRMILETHVVTISDRGIKFPKRDIILWKNIERIEKRYGFLSKSLENVRITYKPENKKESSYESIETFASAYTAREVVKILNKYKKIYTNIPSN
ncbi:MAG: hypothetical protein FWC91_12490 [Defluviitaleaceae bacterium]|nr:hypothetical protein [Defluviitaleaceae bacterium]